MEHKLLAEEWLEFLGGSRRKTVHFDIPKAGAFGPVPQPWKPLVIGKAVVRRWGSDLTMVSLGVSVHRCLQAAHQLQEMGISASVIDLITVSPLDTSTICVEVSQTRRMLVVDEDYQGFGLSGELAAVVLESGIP